MAEQKTERTEESGDGNNSHDNANYNLVRMLEKAHGKQLGNFTTKLTETLISSLTKMVAAIFEITKGSCKRIQEDQVSQGLSKKDRTYVKPQKEDEATCSKYVNRFIFDSPSSDKEDTSVTKAYAKNEQESDDLNERNFFMKTNKIKIKKKLKDSVLDCICQEFTLRENSRNPLVNAKLANVLEKAYLEKISEEKTKFLIQNYENPENCNKMRVPQCNPEN